MHNALYAGENCKTPLHHTGEKLVVKYLKHYINIMIEILNVL